MKKILMLGTGGTLASSHGEKGLTPELHGNEILNKIAGLTDGFEVENEELFMLEYLGEVMEDGDRKDDE